MKLDRILFVTSLFIILFKCCICIGSTQDIKIYESGSFNLDTKSSVSNNNFSIVNKAVYINQNINILKSNIKNYQHSNYNNIINSDLIAKDSLFYIDIKDKENCNYIFDISNSDINKSIELVSSKKIIAINNDLIKKTITVDAFSDKREYLEKDFKYLLARYLNFSVKQAVWHYKSVDNKLILSKFFEQKIPGYNNRNYRNLVINANYPIESVSISISNDKKYHKFINYSYSDIPIGKRKNYVDLNLEKTISESGIRNSDVYINEIIIHLNAGPTQIANALTGIKITSKFENKSDNSSNDILYSDKDLNNYTRFLIPLDQFKNIKSGINFGSLKRSSCIENILDFGYLNRISIPLPKFLAEHVDKIPDYDIQDINLPLSSIFYVPNYYKRFFLGDINNWIFTDNFTKARYEGDDLKISVTGKNLFLSHSNLYPYSNFIKGDIIDTMEINFNFPNVYFNPNNIFMYLGIYDLPLKFRSQINYVDKTSSDFLFSANEGINLSSERAIQNIRIFFDNFNGINSLNLQELSFYSKGSIDYNSNIFNYKFLHSYYQPFFSNNTFTSVKPNSHKGDVLFSLKSTSDYIIFYNIRGIKISTDLFLELKARINNRIEIARIPITQNRGFVKIPFELLGGSVISITLSQSDIHSNLMSYSVLQKIQKLISFNELINIQSLITDNNIIFSESNGVKYLSNYTKSDLQVVNLKLHELSEASAIIFNNIQEYFDLEYMNIVMSGNKIIIKSLSIDKPSIYTILPSLAFIIIFFLLRFKLFQSLLFLKYKFSSLFFLAISFLSFSFYIKNSGSLSVLNVSWQLSLSLISFSLFALIFSNSVISRFKFNLDPKIILLYFAVLSLLLSFVIPIFFPEISYGYLISEQLAMLSFIFCMIFILI